MARHRAAYPIRLMCRVLKVSASGYYAWQNRPGSPRKCENRRLLAEIRTIHAKSMGTYGSLRIHVELQENGFSCGRHRVVRLMRTAGISGIPKRRFRRTTSSGHTLPVAPNLLKQNFSATMPNQPWVSDITYVRTGEGWLYVAAILDLYSRKVVGWGTSSRLQRGLVLEALAMALGRSTPGSGLIHHSDRGSQYASQDFQNLLRVRGIICSMSGSGNCFDNAVAESFFATLKRERVYRRRYQTRAEATTDIFQYIEIFYNLHRRHSAIEYSMPSRYESGKSQMEQPHDDDMLFEPFPIPLRLTKWNP